MASRGDLDAFLAEVEARATRMAALAMGNLDDALDIVQDAMFSFVRHYADKPQEQWRPLFYRVLQNGIRDALRRRSVRRAVVQVLDWWRGGEAEPPGEDPLERLADPAARDPAELAAAGQGMDALLAAVAKLPARQQQTFLLRAWEGLDTAETALAMGLTEGSVKTHYSRALAALREKLKDYAP